MSRGHSLPALQRPGTAVVGTGAAALKSWMPPMFPLRAVFKEETHKGARDPLSVRRVSVSRGVVALTRAAAPLICVSPDPSLDLGGRYPQPLYGHARCSLPQIGVRPAHAITSIASTVPMPAYGALFVGSDPAEPRRCPNMNTMILCVTTVEPLDGHNLRLTFNDGLVDRKSVV